MIRKIRGRAVVVGKKAEVEEVITQTNKQLFLPNLLKLTIKSSSADIDIQRFILQYEHSRLADFILLCVKTDERLQDCASIWRQYV